jgi:mono/diheme cytochrome c family protein
MKAKLALWIFPWVVATAAGAAGTGKDASALERGRYLVGIGGCNDCHTPGYAESAGNVPDAERLTGSPVGFQGPWGTTYPANLRLVVQTLTEAEWLARVQPPRGEG